jgi:putative membrane protein
MHHSAVGLGCVAQWYSRDMKLLLKWCLSAMSLMALAQIDAGIVVAGFGSALIAALVMGLLNLFVRPVLVVLTLPVTLVSLGLFYFVINAFLFWAASEVLEGFQVAGFGHALLGSLIYSIMGVVIDSALERLFAPRLS